MASAQRRITIELDGTDQMIDRANELSDVAWRARMRARVLGRTPVGCAALAASGEIYSGCNVEHRFRSHDMHAETNAIGNMISGGDDVLIAIFIAAERERFTPCGACMDWIFEFGGSGCQVIWQSHVNGKLQALSAHDLMPHYPQ